MAESLSDKSVAELEREIHLRLAELRRRAATAPPPHVKDVALACENWVRGRAWDETFTVETVADELARIERAVRARLAPADRERLVQLWRALYSERHAAAA